MGLIPLHPPFPNLHGHACPLCCPRPGVLCLSNCQRGGRALASGCHWLQRIKARWQTRLLASITLVQAMSAVQALLLCLTGVQHSSDFSSTARRRCQRESCTMLPVCCFTLWVLLVDCHRRSKVGASACSDSWCERGKRRVPSGLCMPCMPYSWLPGGTHMDHGCMVLDNEPGFATIPSRI